MTKTVLYTAAIMLVALALRFTPSSMAQTRNTARTNKVKSFDHLVINVSDMERALAFYKRLGFTLINEDGWRKGQGQVSMRATISRSRPRWDLRPLVQRKNSRDGHRANSHGGAVSLAKLFRGANDREFCYGQQKSRFVAIPVMWRRSQSSPS